MTTKEQLVTVSGYAISNWYGVPDKAIAADLTYAAADTKAVATVILSKNVAGTVYIYNDSVSKYTRTAFDSQAIATTGETSKAKGVSAAAGTNNVMEDAADMTEKNAITATTGYIKHINSDGSVTIMFLLATTERGAKYKFAFDQANNDTDDIPTAAQGGSTTIAVSDPVESPYITAPAKLAVTSAIQGGDVTVEVQDAEGKALAWMGSNNAITLNGFSGATVYYNTSNGTSGATKSFADADLKSGAKGVFKGTDTSTNGKYFYAEATTAKGIFGAESVKLTSEIKGENASLVDAVKISEDTTTATSAVVKFTNLVTDGTIYIYKSSDTFDKDNTATYRAKADVKKGDPSVTLANAFKTTGDINVNFDVVILPADETNYTKFDTKTSAATDTFTLEEEAKSVKAGNKNFTANWDDAAKTITIKGLEAYNQFGSKMSTAKTTETTATVTAINKTAYETEAGLAAWTIPSADGALELVIYDKSTQGTSATATANLVDEKDGYSIAILGSTVEVTNLEDEGTGVGTAWAAADASLTSDKISIKVDGTAAKVGQVKTGAITYTTSAATSITTAAVRIGTLAMVDQNGDPIAFTEANDGATVTTTAYNAGTWYTAEDGDGTKAPETVGLGLGTDGKVYIKGSVTLATVTGAYTFIVKDGTTTIGTLTVTLDGSGNSTEVWTAA